MKGSVQGLGGTVMADAWFLEDLQQCTRGNTALLALATGWDGGQAGVRAAKLSAAGSWAPVPTQAATARTWQHRATALRVPLIPLPRAAVVSYGY